VFFGGQAPFQPSGFLRGQSLRSSPLSPPRSRFRRESPASCFPLVDSRAPVSCPALPEGSRGSTALLIAGSDACDPKYAPAPAAAAAPAPNPTAPLSPPPPPPPPAPKIIRLCGFMVLVWRPSGSKVVKGFPPTYTNRFKPPSIPIGSACVYRPVLLSYCLK
jgi:hypothetical protein